MLTIPTLGYSQVGIGTANPNPSAILELSSPNKAFLLTRVALKHILHTRGKDLKNTKNKHTTI